MLRVLSCLLALLLALFPAARGEEETRLYMINVGKGDAVLILAEGKNYLIDTGKKSAWEKVEAALAEFDVTRLDGVFITHTDKDHTGGIKELLKSGVEVEKWYASAFYTCTDEEHPLLKQSEKHGFPVTLLSAGDTAENGLFTVLAPLRQDVKNEDDNSLVMLLKTPAGPVLLAGDMEEDEENDLLRSGAELKSTVLKVPNHGDDDACGDGLVRACAPVIALISTDPYDKPGTPAPAVLNRLERAGCEIFRTDFSEKGILVTLTADGARAENR